MVLMIRMPKAAMRMRTVRTAVAIVIASNKTYQIGNLPTEKIYLQALDGFLLLEYIHGFQRNGET